jgi:hypothetical protein
VKSFTFKIKIEKVSVTVASLEEIEEYCRGIGVLHKRDLDPSAIQFMVEVDFEETDVFEQGVELGRRLEEIREELSSLGVDTTLTRENVVLA